MKLRQRRRRTVRRVAAGALEGVLAALRPSQHAWAAPWAGRPRADLGAAVLLGLHGLVVSLYAASAVLNGRGGLAGGWVFLLLLPVAAALALAPRRPLDGWLVVTGWLLGLHLFLLPASPDPGPVLDLWAWLLWMPVLVLAGWAARGPELTGVVLLSAAALLALSALRPLVLEEDATIGSIFTLGVPLAVGAALGARQRAGAALLEQQDRVERALAHQGALAERARIAREMHDVVAHHMSMIAVRAETAPYRLVDVSPSVRTELAEVAAAARQSLGEMQDLLGVLRDGDDVERTPQPGIAELSELLHSSRAAGADVSWDLDRPDVPPALGLTAYRVVQQSLANAAQHAAGSPVRVRLDHRDSALRIEVVNGPGTAASTPGSGAGLTGMRERAQLHGGTLEAGPTADGGFAVSVCLPVGRPA